METKLSTKGQVVLPSSVRRKLGLQAGDLLDTEVRDGRVILTPRRRRSRKAKIIVDSLTGLPALTAGSDAETLTSKQVDDILAEVP